MTIETEHFMSRDVDVETMRQGRTAHRFFRAVNLKSPLYTVCLIEQHTDRPATENEQRVRYIIELLEAGAEARKRKGNHAKK